MVSGVECNVLMNGLMSQYCGLSHSASPCVQNPWPLIVTKQCPSSPTCMPTASVLAALVGPWSPIRFDSSGPASKAVAELFQDYVVCLCL